MSGLVQPPEHVTGPDWFVGAVMSPSTSHRIDVDGATIHYRTWDAPEDCANANEDKPGLLLVHGGAAHSHWWDFVAPFFTQGFHVAAFDLSGCGDSSWRPFYNFELHAREALAVLRDSGMLDKPLAPIVVGHSFGGYVTLMLGRLFGQHLRGIVVVDSPVRSREMMERDAKKGLGPPQHNGRKRVYATREAVTGRFSLLPPQPCDNDFIMQYIAHFSVEEISADEAAALRRPGEVGSTAGAGGWTWKFDDQRFEKSRKHAVSSGNMDPRPESQLDAMATFFSGLLRGINCRMGFIYGVDSFLCQEEVVRHMQNEMLIHRPGGFAHTPVIAVPEAAHHVMLDQPLAFVALLRALLEAGEWGRLDEGSARTTPSARL